MTDTPDWALVTPTMKHSVEELTNWLAATPRYKPGLKMSKADMIVMLNLARQNYWDQRHKEANAAPPARAIRRPSEPTAVAPKVAKGRITAAECNAWLATLPVRAAP